MLAMTAPTGPADICTVVAMMVACVVLTNFLTRGR
jgi:hypothetical protein